MQLKLLAATGFMMLALAGNTQQDSAYIQKLDKPNSLGLSTGLIDYRFYFKSPDGITPGLNLYANNGAFIGPFIKYNILAARLNIRYPGSRRVSDASGIQNYRIRLNTYRAGWGLQLNAVYFRGLIRGGEKYTTAKDLRYVSIAPDLYYATNDRHFSLKAARFTEDIQVKSAGSFIFHVTPSYNDFSEKKDAAAMDNGMQRFFTPFPRWFSVTGSVGYAYNLVPRGSRWLIAPMIEGGYGGLRQNHVGGGIQSVSFAKGTIAAGYNAVKTYYYASGEYFKMKSNLSYTDLIEERVRLSFTAGYRIGSFKKKILGIL